MSRKAVCILSDDADPTLRRDRASWAILRTQYADCNLVPCAKFRSDLLIIFPVFPFDKPLILLVLSLLRWLQGALRPTSC